MRQPHQAVKLGFSEFTRRVRIKTVLATAILARYPAPTFRRALENHRKLLTKTQNELGHVRV